MSSRYLFTFSFLLFANAVLAQQVFPVSLTGLLIPPHSLDLSVYGTQRAQDLIFTAALTDPIEPFRDTRLKLYIENNGQTLYTTDPNYGFQALRLNRNQPVTLDGFALQPYLRPETLIGAAGQGQGSVIIPEGLNRICLEVIDLQRNVPISRKACVTGGFFLNEPPILQMPICGANVPQTNFQSQTFTWTPLHNGSGNSPAPVEYLFQLVQLQPGTDPNDGFDFSLIIMERTTMSPSLIYGPTDPLLQPGQIYAWRVQARSMMKPGLIFRNYGFSQVCPFVYGDGFAPFGGPQAAEQMEEDRVPPQGCEVFDTDFGPIFAQDYVPAVVAEGDTVKVGWFDLVVESAFDRGNGYDGRGTIKIPMLNAPVMVDFRRLKVKPNTNRCYEVHSISGLANTPQFFYEMQDGSYPADYYFTQVKNDFENGPLQNALTNQMDINGTAVMLPLGIPSEDGPYMVIINEINFTPRNATMTCTGYQVNEDGSFNGFGPTEVPITPYGVKNGARLKVQHGESPYANFAGIFFAGNGGETDKTGMDIDCGGFKSLFLDTEFVIDSTMMKSLDGGEARFRLASNKADPNNYFGGIKKLDGFTLPKLPGYQFKVKNGQLDLASDKKTEQNKLESFYQEPNYDTWQGLYLSDVEAMLPADLNLLGDGKPVQLDNGDFVLDWSGGHGHFSKTNLLSLSKGRLGSWPYSIDSLQLLIAEGEPKRTWMSGQVKVPVLDEPFRYASELNTFGQTSLNIDLVQGQRTMSLWQGKMEVSADSKLRAVLKDFGPAGKKFMPDADLSGVFSMAFTAKEFDDALVGNKAIIKQRLKQIFGYANGAPDFRLENLAIGHLLVDPYKLPAERYLLSTYTPDSLGLSIGKIPAQVGQIRLVYKENDGNGREELGFQVVVKKGQNLVQFTFFAKAKPNGDGFLFDRIEVETEEVDCNCHAFVPFEEMQPEQLDQMLRRTYQQFYAPAVGGNLVPNSSGLASALAPGFAEQKENLLLPKNTRLLITGFEASGEPYTEQNTSVEFTLLVQVNDSSYAQFVRPDVRVSPTSVDMADFYMFLAEAAIDFGLVELGNNKEEGFGISNSGDGVLNLSGNPIVAISGAHASQFSVTKAPDKTSLPQYGVTLFNVRFTPTGAAGERTATLTILNNDPNEGSYIINLKGTVAVPNIVVRLGTESVVNKPSALPGTQAEKLNKYVDFGNVKFGESSKLTFTIANTGNGELRLNKQSNPLFMSEPQKVVQVYGRDPYWFKVEPDFSTVSIPAGGSADFTAYYTPGARLSSMTGTKYVDFTISSNDPDEGTFVINGKAFGTAPEVDIKVDGVSLASGGTVDFGAVPSYSAKERNFSIHNTGDAPLKLTNLTNGTIFINGDFSWVSGLAVTSLNPDEKADFKIKFEPKSVGDLTGAFTLNNDDPDEGAYLINFKGSGLPTAEIDVTYDGIINNRVSVISVPSGGTIPNTFSNKNKRTFTYTIKNTGSKELKLTGNPKVTVSGPDAARVTLLLSGTSATVASGQSTSFSLEFLPTVSKLHEFSITIPNDDADEGNYVLNFKFTVQ